MLCIIKSKIILLTTMLDLLLLYVHTFPMLQGQHPEGLVDLVGQPADKQKNNLIHRMITIIIIIIIMIIIFYGPFLQKDLESLYYGLLSREEKETMNCDTLYAGYNL